MNMFSYPKEPNNNKMMTSSSFNSCSSYNNNNNNNNNEDFSFPVISNNPLSNFMLSSSSASSSSLWRISSKVYHHQEEYDERGENSYDNNYYGCYDHIDRMEVRSMSEEILPSRRESIACASFQSKDFEVEERMDYLWEDFNEEEKSNEVKQRRLGEEIGVLKMRNMSRRRSSSSNNNNGSKMLVLGKLLKGLVSIRRSAQHKLSKTRF